MSEALLKNHIECAPPKFKLLKEYSGKIHKAKRLRLIGRQGDSGFVRAPFTRSEPNVTWLFTRHFIKQ